MTCKACTDAMKVVHHEFHDCPGCRARAVARSNHFSQAWKAKRQHREYRQLLEHARVTHELAIDAAKNDRACDALLANPKDHQQ